METTAQATTTDVPVSQTVQETDNGDQPKQETKAQEEKRKFKAKVNGREVEVDEDTLLKDYQKYQAADEKFRAAAEKEKKYSKYADLENALQNKDLSVLSKYVDPDTIRQFSEKQLLEYLEYQGLTDEQKELLEARNRIKEFEDEKTKAEQAKAEQERLQINQQAMQVIDNEISNTFKELGVKPTPAMIIRTAMQMDAALSQGKFLSGKEAYRRASKDLSNDLNGYLETVDEKELANILPKRVIDAIRRQSVENAQAPFARNSKTDSQIPARSNGKIRATTEDYFKTLDQKYQRR